MNRTEGQNLATLAGAALAAAEVDAATGTDPITLANELAAGRPAVLVMAPRIERETYHSAEATWDVLAMAPQWDDPDAAWATLDRLLEVLGRSDVLAWDTAEPVQYDARQGRSYPAYRLELTTDHDTTD